MKIGFIGLGAMGAPICRNLTGKSGAEVTTFDIDPAALARCPGAKAKGSAAEAIAGADVVFTSLPRPEHVRAVALGENGIRAHARPGAIFVDLSTNSLSTVKSVGAELAAAGITMLDTPVSGGIILADRGQLTAMVGGDAAAFETCKPLFETFAANIFHVGALGSGTIAKLTNNFIALCSLIASAEGLTLGTAAGMDLEALHKVIGASSGNSLPFRSVSAAARRRDFSPKFALELAAKDLELALELSHEIGAPRWMADAARSVLKRAESQELGKEDMAAVLKVYEATTGHETGANS